MAYKYSNRISIEEHDYSTPVSVPEGEQIGFTIVKSKNGPKKAVFIEGGDLNTFKDIFGEPETAKITPPSDSNNADKGILTSLYEAQRFVSSYSCYISAPFTGTAKVNALKLSKSGNTYSLSSVETTYNDTENSETGKFYDSAFTANSDAIALFIPKYPTDRKLHIELKGSDVSTDKTRLFVTAWMEGAYHNESHKYTNIEIDLDDTAVAEDGSYVGCTPRNQEYFENNLFICESKSTLTDVDLHGMSATGVTSELTSGVKTPSFDWSILTSEASGLSQAELESINVVFSTETFEGTTNNFFSLGDNEDLKTSCFLFNFTPAVSTADALSFGNRYWNIYNTGFITLSNGRKIRTNFVGDRAVMQCRINDVKYGGWAPMYLNTGTSTSGIGGQLGIKVDKMEYNLKKSQIEDLCKKNYNPVIKDSTYGTMLVNQMTCKGGAKTDWSYIGHVASFLQFEKDMLPIMKDQIGKPNNPYYRNLRASQVQRLLDLRTSGEDRIWAEAVVDTSTNDGINDADNRNNRIFVISVKVKVEVFSEWVVLNFTNVDQATVLG